MTNQLFEECVYQDKQINMSKITNIRTIAANLKIGTFNVANSPLEEASKTVNFSLREKQIIKTINDIDADILGLNELRNYGNKQPVNFLGKLTNCNHIYDYMNGHKSMAMGILYKRSKVYPMQIVKKWLSTTPDVPSDDWGNGFGRIILGVKFLPVLDEQICINSKPLWIFIVHLGLGEFEKDQCVKLIPGLIKSIVHKDDNFLILGDFNFFDDKNGLKQREVLVNSGMIDVGTTMNFYYNKTSEIGVRAFGTFLGFNDDNYKSSYDQMIQSNCAGRLDNIFISQNLKYQNVMVFAESQQEVIDRKTPSDHLPLICNINW
jgi:predicted extracellular nuclease